MGRLEKRNKKRKRKKVTLWVLLTFLVILLVIIGYGGYLTTKFAHVTDLAHDVLQRGDKSALRDKKVNPFDDNISILFMGVDKRKGQDVPSRSDALVLATFNQKDDSIKLVSIPRDSKVPIIDPTGKKDYGMDKITHAHAYGDARGGMGVDFTVATVENLFHVPVDYYVQVDFQAFTKIVDALDGVTVDVPVKLVTQNSHDKKGAIVLQPGKQKVNGEQALAFVRNRKSPGAGGDFGRGQRQMALIKAMIHKGASLTSVTKYDNVIDSLKGHFKTNLTFKQLIGLQQYASSISNIDMMQLKGQNDMSTGVYYFDLDDDYVNQVSKKLRKHLGLPINSTSYKSSLEPSTDSASGEPQNK
ncbi:LytR family transcriptional attenuator [Scopulibacillus darangshiensis]|uniref:LytR family transcriptional attenuator n=1 Tax=Scopulibacillus darangshiensis TaxID=442528 RepID=A0A4R2NWL6_9BACL|nr:LCP family protein [Scopulibacillus darangshiensis]TCP26018.1 LytR family transcriptional attenuator [Scopulibacillus darangshiensis]